MARFLIAAIDLESKYKQGEIITVQPDSHVWTEDEGLPFFWQVDVAQLGISIAQQAVGNLYEPAMPGDVELGAPDIEDRVIRRGRGHVRFFPESLPRGKLRDLEADGAVTLNLGQAISTYRRVVWHRPSSEARDTGIGAFG